MKICRCGRLRHVRQSVSFSFVLHSSCWLSTVAFGAFSKRAIHKELVQVTAPQKNLMSQPACGVPGYPKKPITIRITGWWWNCRPQGGHFLKAASVNIRCSSRLPVWPSMRAAMRRILKFICNESSGWITSSLQTCASLWHLLPGVLMVSWSSAIFKPAFTDFSRTNWICNRCKSDPKSCSWFSCVRVHINKERKTAPESWAKHTATILVGALRQKRLHDLPQTFVPSILPYRNVINIPPTIQDFSALKRGPSPRWKVAIQNGCNK